MALQLSYSPLLTSLKLATQNNHIIDPTYVIDRECKAETLLNCRPYTFQNSLTFYYNAGSLCLTYYTILVINMYFCSLSIKDTRNFQM